jgi:hypothetical protein
MDSYLRDCQTFRSLKIGQRYRNRKTKKIYEVVDYIENCDEGGYVFRYVIGKKPPRFKLCEEESITAIKRDGMWHTQGATLRRAK